MNSWLVVKAANRNLGEGVTGKLAVCLLTSLQLLFFFNSISEVTGITHTMLTGSCQVFIVSN